MNNKCLSRLPQSLLLSLILGTGLTVANETDDSTAATRNLQATVQPGTYSDKGADTCIKCHDEDDDYPVFDIFKTKHAQQGDKRSPFAGLQCEACHGPGIAGPEAIQEIVKKGGHTGKVRPGQERPPILSFGNDSDVPIARQNSQCLACHASDNHITWKGSAHEGDDIGCANCHRIHTPEDAVLAKTTQPVVCYTCHQTQRLEFSRVSSHPLRFGQMACSDCHKAHGSSAASLLLKPTLNQTCFVCHAEKRGTLLWEHAPVAEDCSLCHTPHGSSHPALLSKRAPLLCQQCPSQIGHPSLALTGAGLPSASPSAFLLGNSCVNCHSQIHGSNHPSGVKLMR
jgi:DmsE family decaheme c-type cytochrome